MKTSILLTLALGMSLAVPGICQQASTAYYSGIYKETSIFPHKSFNDSRNALHSRLLSLFPLAENPSWSIVDHTSKVIFTQQGLTTKAFFLTDGTLSYALTNYPAERLPEEMLRNIFQTYKQHSILSAKELKSPTSQTFYVIVENEVSYKTLKITDNHIEQVKKLRKSTYNQGNG